MPDPVLTPSAAFIDLKSSEAVARRLSSAPPVKVYVTVYNGGAAVERCIQSVLNHSSGADVVVIDDGSTDLATLELLGRLALDDRVNVIQHTSNFGYTRTANHALEHAGRSDLVLLNSDTVVGPGWLGRLRRTAYSQEKVATVSAASDNAGAMSLPQTGSENEWAPPSLWHVAARTMLHRVDIEPQVVPTAHGFCIYLRRDALDEVGGFDAKAFPRGYGEENDFSTRAIERGWLNLWDPRVLVHHEKGASFGSAREELIKAARAQLNRMHPGYSDRVAQWLGSGTLEATRASAAAAYRDFRSGAPALPRVLYVIHRSAGGTPATNLDLMGALAGEQDSFLLEAVGGTKVVLSRLVDGRLATLETWTPASEFAITDTWRDDYAAWLVAVLDRYAVETVHVRHLINQPVTTVPEVCRLLGLRLIYSTHDFYTICPTIHLLDEKMNYCGGICTPGEGRCTLQSRFTQGVPEPLKHGWISEWQRRMLDAFACADYVVATTNSAAEIMLRSYPQLKSRLVVIEHGREVETFGPARRGESRTPGPLRIAAPAMWYPQKGGGYLREIALELGDKVEWHVLGHAAEQFEDFAVVHGSYDRVTLVPIMQEIDPDLVGIFSLWPETYSHTLTEAWAMGVPVVTTDIGAVAERIRDHGGGTFIPLGDAKAAAEIIDRMASNPASISGICGPAPTDGVRALTATAADYSRLYRPEDVPIGLASIA